MKHQFSTFLVFAALFAVHSAAFAQEPPNYQPDTDWLLDPAPYKAKIAVDREGGKIVLSNGLIERTITTKPGAATTGFLNLMTGESVIRAVNPEAEVTIDGRKYPVGGLTGQKNRAFLRDEWIAGMTPPPNALVLTGIEQGVPKERFAWKRVRHCAPDAQWPPKGVYLRMDYAMPDASPGRAAAAAMPSAEGRKLLLEDEFLKLDPAWKIHVSKAHERSSFDNEGKPGEIYTPANTSVYAERALPEGTRLVEATIHPGEDTSSTWGPGMALVWPKGTAKFFIRSGIGAGDARFGVWDGRRETVMEKGPRPDKKQAVRLRMRIEGAHIFCETRAKPGSAWQSVATIDINPAAGSPRAVRIGKMDKRGGGTDFRTPAKLVRLKIERFAAYGPLDEKATENRAAAASPAAKASGGGIVVSVHYELYDGVPLISKWITVRNGTGKAINLDRFRAEDLSVVEYDNPVGGNDKGLKPPQCLHVETDMSFGGFTTENANFHAIHWETEKNYRTQVNWLRNMPCRLVVEPTYGPDQTVKPGAVFESFRVFELVFDGTERDRRGLALKRMYRTVAPWVTENPLMFHMRRSNPEAVRQAVDQCAETGFELIILSFGSGFRTESKDPAYLKKWRGIADYAHSKGVGIGSYSLLSSRGVKPASNMIVSPKGQKPTHGRCPALTSEWGQEYFKTLRNHFEQTGFDIFEHDGSYPGDVDVTPRPPLQKGINDSRWAQWKVISKFYQWLRGRGVYINVPDFYYLAGTNKCGMGYREVNWALPRAQQLVHTRQNIYDGTWKKTPSMGWMFVPLTSYHGGGAAATVEPLAEHLAHYEAMMRSNLGLGVQACYRGPRLYDTPATRDMVKRVVAWFKAHRDILESDMIHGRRADGRDIDWMLHVNPKLEEKGYLAVFNPTDREITKTLRVSLYYTGLVGKAAIREDGGAEKIVQMDSDHFVKITVTIPPGGFRGYIVRGRED
jgi:hypothetical protein